MIIKFKKEVEHAILPQYKTSGAAGFDLATIEKVEIAPGTWRVIDTGLSVSHIPTGYELQIRGRSGLAFNNQVLAFNGTIDSDYRGNIKILLFNHGDQVVEFDRGERVAQCIVAQVVHATIQESDDKSVTDRGDKGFGSTGLT